MVEASSVTRGETFIGFRNKAAIDRMEWRRNFRIKKYAGSGSARILCLLSTVKKSNSLIEAVDDCCAEQD